MVEIYVFKIKNNEMKIQQVPTLWRKKVEAALK